MSPRGTIARLLCVEIVYYAGCSNLIKSSYLRNATADQYVLNEELKVDTRKLVMYVKARTKSV